MGLLTADRDFRVLRRSDFRLRMPFVLSSPPTVALGVSNATTQISGSVLVPSYEAGAFSFFGPRPRRGTGYPSQMGVSSGAAYAVTSPAPMGIEFIFETADPTGRIEFYTSNNGQKWSFAVGQRDGSWGYCSAGVDATPLNDGGATLILVTLGAPGRYVLRADMAWGNCWFYGVRVTPGSTVRANVPPKRTIAVLGDSWSEPTIVDTATAGPHAGWPVQLGLMTGINFVCAGSGGTGYLQTNGARPKFRDRLDEVLAESPDGLIFAGGVNDLSNWSSAQLAAELAILYPLVRSALPSGEIVALAPFSPLGLTTGAVGKMLAFRDVIRAAAAGIGARFLDLLSLPQIATLFPPPASMALAAAAAANASSISVNAIPDANSDWYVQVGTGDSGAGGAEIRKVTNTTGSGPYTLSLSTGLTNSHPSGDVCRVVGPQMITGTGKQTSTNGSGNSDYFIGSDGSHPTIAGHRHVAMTIATLWAQSLPL